MSEDTREHSISTVAGKILKLLESENLTMHGAICAINYALSHMKYADPCRLPFSISDDMVTCHGFPEFPEFIIQDEPGACLSTPGCPDQ